ncbi:Hydrogenase maturation protein, carbamoyl dehydratase HypE [Desulfocapsa sulfexigens DSM 10523]|uniref:Hydrogenase maturation protein, carbamoyl dehydratase HypE n=1 Tax=Desulfocapsa sulfexigens (strain DSM 10523 / SB164P1) TaxID=1167006 RepID=M1PDA3_DESSD|nr:hydrogenase expression/formation protein HypE [Desulfocapsa sulfexigens]AGF77730.1 Hydrogenase maturation protein, carbamoyl dehydratase HypE [Desulfocapsa sulfexigens DSM 10523]
MNPGNTILLDHGSGGIASQELISQIFLKHLDNSILASLEDSAVMENHPGKIAFSTDSYVVDPIFFPGGNIGTLAVHGTINDLTMRGARPLCLSLGLILEEGFKLDDLERVIVSIAECAKSADVPIVTGDTKVVPRGKCDKIFINTSGIGIVEDGVNVSSTMAQEGDLILLSGSMGDHGITIMTRRAGISLDGNLASDSAALNELVALLLDKLPSGSLHTLRDPTRGGVATSLNEIAAAAGLAVEIDDQAIPVKPEVRAACEIMGLDPLYLANEGKCLALVAPEQAAKALQLMRSTAVGTDAAIIGSLKAGKAGQVVLRTAIGGSRIITPLHGEPLPRIC